MLKLDLRAGESIRIGDYATITLEEKSGKMARIAFDADKSIPITRVVVGQGNAIATHGVKGLRLEPS